MRDDANEPVGVVLVMGVSGAGKTTIGKMLAESLGWSFFDGDDFHPQQNVDKMASGIPLDDQDRWPWLEAIRALIDRRLDEQQSAVIACSALKRVYRELLLDGAAGVELVYLQGTRELLLERLRSRSGHFMPPDLLDSQLGTLEEPKRGVTIAISGTPEEIVSSIRRRLD